ncbi:speckle-type POZ protein B-like [Nasonia vitripennis]|uniref:BTB domain-containing protein n=1 Tax=Nasonia vitripennis TaxID=7425 RepID=A0A7M7HGK1_NASVI|nr:speckle-type POZ protein B-like [Nasonia vitripennis]
MVEIADIKYGVLMEMIRFIYAGKTNDIDALADDLAVAADKYALDGLKNICEKRMLKILNMDNVINFVQLADTFQMVKLKKKAIEFIVKNALYCVGNKPEFGLLPQDIVFEVFQCMANKLA